MMRWTHFSSERDGDDFEFDCRHTVALCDVWVHRLGQAMYVASVYSAIS